MAGMKRGMRGGSDWRGSGERGGGAPGAGGEVARNGPRKRAQDTAPVAAAGGGGGSRSALAVEAFHEQVDAVAPLELVETVGVPAGDDDAPRVAVRNGWRAATGGAGVASGKPRVNAVGMEGVGAREVQQAAGRNARSRGVGFLADRAQCVVIVTDRILVS